MLKQIAAHKPSVGVSDVTAGVLCHHLVVLLHLQR